MPQAITGPVKHYPWGDTRFIPELLGIEPDGQPWAELWLGTHPAGAAAIVDDGTPLTDVTGPLPYLLKVLAAAEPLSLQAHPNTVQAQEGYDRGLFPDPNPKPELLMALTEFHALCGVRPVARSVALLRSLGLDGLAEDLERRGPGAILTDLYRTRIPAGPIVQACAATGEAEARLVTELDHRYPGDPSVAATLLLNHVRLAPGQALHLTAGNLHAYLHGAGIELMGASDNVVRGGLTTKHVDVDGLLAVVDPTPLAEPVMIGADATGRYPLREIGRELRRITAGAEHRSTGHELAIGLDGSAWYVSSGEQLRPTVDTFIVTTAV